MLETIVEYAVTEPLLKNKAISNWHAIRSLSAWSVAGFHQSPSWSTLYDQVSDESLKPVYPQAFAASSSSSRLIFSNPYKRAQMVAPYSFPSRRVDELPCTLTNRTRHMDICLCLV
jgi:hypothetical protein